MMKRIMDAAAAALLVHPACQCCSTILCVCSTSNARGAQASRDLALRVHRVRVHLVSDSRPERVVGHRDAEGRREFVFQRQRSG